MGQTAKSGRLRVSQLVSQSVSEMVQLYCALSSLPLARSPRRRELDDLPPPSSPFSSPFSFSLDNDDSTLSPSSSSSDPAILQRYLFECKQTRSVVLLLLLMESAATSSINLCILSISFLLGTLVLSIQRVPFGRQKGRDGTRSHPPGLNGPAESSLYYYHYHYCLLVDCPSFMLAIAIAIATSAPAS